MNNIYRTICLFIQYSTLHVSIGLLHGIKHFHQSSDFHVTHLLCKISFVELNIAPGSLKHFQIPRVAFIALALEELFIYAGRISQQNFHIDFYHVLVHLDADVKMS